MKEDEKREEFEIAEEESKNYEQLLEEAKAEKREEELHEASASISQEITTIATIEPQVIETSVDTKKASEAEPEEEKGPDTTKLSRRTNLRTLPDGNSNNITTLPAGTDVIVIGEAQGGYKMVQYNGMTGYILDNTTVNKVDVSKLGGEAVLFTCTAYCSCKKCCGSYSPEVRGGVAHTATGTVPQEGRTIAVDPSVIPYGTKVAIDGNVAGPKILEHMVDTVLYFEGDRHASYRVLRGVKNRFGSTNEIGVFEMRESGLAEVLNPSEFMLSGRAKDASGSVVTCSMEGTRSIFIEIQALVTQTNFGFPKRQSTGIDNNRVSLLMAVLEKKIGMPLGNCDAYVNVAGGIKVSEPSVDLGLILAISIIKG